MPLSHSPRDASAQALIDPGDPRPLPPHVLHSRLAQIAREHPSLCSAGIYCTAHGSHADFAKLRQDLYSHTDQIAAIQRYIWADWPILYCEGKVHSYALKCRAEEYFAETGEHKYISHGAAIAAVLAAGFTIKRQRHNSPNVTIIFRSRGRRWAGCGQMTRDGWA